MFRGCAPLRTPAHRDPNGNIPRPCESRSPRKGCGLDERFGYLTETPSRVVNKSPPLQTAREGEITMTAALRDSSQSASSAIASHPGESNTSTSDDGLSAFLRMRPRLFGIAYRMLGSAAEAEDVVQDVWLRWQTTDRSVVRDAAAFLVTTATRLAINVMQSARARRETYVGALAAGTSRTRAATLGWQRNEARRWRVAFGCCWKS